jgi:hypothetical protein
MTYRGYEITAEVKGYDVWTLTDEGRLDEWQNESDGVEVTGYFITRLSDGEELDFRLGEDIEVATEFIDQLAGAA